MIRLLPFGLIAVLVIGLVFFRFFYSNKLAEPELREVPKEAPFNQTLSSDPGGVLDNMNILASQILALKTSYENLNNETGQTIASLERRVKSLEASVLQLQSQSGTQTSTSTQASSSSKVPAYIPLGSDGTVDDQNWYSVPGFAVSIDPAEYSGYTGMQLEGSVRLVEKAGTAYIRLLNSTDGTTISGEASTTQDTFQIVSTSAFTLTSGRKTYQLQVKSSSGKQVQIQNARIKVSF